MKVSRLAALVLCLLGKGCYMSTPLVPSPDSGGEDAGGEDSLPGSCGHGLECDLVQLAAGYSHTCGVRESGEAVCWGNNVFRNLGSPGRGWREPVLAPVEGL